MSDVELLVRETLGRHEAEVPTLDLLDAHPVAIRARRRQVLNTVAAGFVALILALGAVSGVGALLRADGRRPAIEPTPTPRAEAPPNGFIGLPPEGSPPSLPKASPLMIALDGGDNSGYGHVRSIYVYADGRFIWQKFGCDARPKLCESLDVPEAATTLESGWLEQRLTPEGIELLRSEILASGLFDGGDLRLAVETNLSDWWTFSVEARRPRGLVSVSASRTNQEGWRPATREEVRALRRLYELFVDLEARLPATAWQDRGIRGFVPSCYVAAYSMGLGASGPPDPSELPPPANELLHGRASEQVTTEEARAIAIGFWGGQAKTGRLAPPQQEQRLTFSLKGGAQLLQLSPVLPHEANC
ncbi:MAG: hypothetical protein WB297_14070 [Actinomycetota bacterium]